MWWYLLILLPAAIGLWLIYEWFEHTFVQYTTTEVECQKLPINQQLRICLISDLHNNKKNLEKMIKRIRGFEPEVILLAGDMIDKHKIQNNQAERFLAAIIELKIPVFYSMGNHELSLAEKQPEAWEKYLKTLPKEVVFLSNEAVLLKETKEICISGVSLPKAYYKKGGLYENTEELPDIKIPPNNFHVLMAHHPEYAEFYQKYHADFIVSGHLHGGLLRLPFVGGVVSPRLRLPQGCDAGLIMLPQGNQMFVSRGLGSHTIPLRFFNRVEVNFLVLKGTKE